MSRRIAAIVAFSLLVPSPCAAGGGYNGQPPIFVPGVRAVDIRNTTGGLARYTTIPSNSLFATTGSGRPCSFVAGGPGVTSDGQHYVGGQTVTSAKWLFTETTIVGFGEGGIDTTRSRGPLKNAYRSFNVYCDSIEHFTGYLLVYPSDPMLNPHSQLTNLYNALQLAQPTIFRNPVVDKWGGLITRYPAWLAINPAAWQPHVSNAVAWRGWLMYLNVTPIALDFHVIFTPDPTQPSPAFDGIVACVPRNGRPTADTRALPAFPTLPDHTAPGVNGACMWTPPGPGSVTIQARITYRVVFWANGYTESLPDYVWSSAPTRFTTGELSSVNTNG